MEKHLFIHIPKTGGSSIMTCLYENRKDNWIRDKTRINHDFFSYLKSKNNISNVDKLFTVVRNPYTRTISYYFHFLRVHHRRKNFRYYRYTFTDFLNLINSKNYNLKNTPMIFYDQTEYLLDNKKKLFDGKIFNYEKFEEIETYLNKKIPKINVGNYTKDDFLKIYNNKNIESVKKIYARDFEMLNYSTSFYESIEDYVNRKI